MDKMQSLITADNFSGYLFWDANRSEISLEEHAPYIIQRVLEYGSMNDWKLVYNYYGLEKIVNVCKRLRTLEPTSLSFICTISHTKKRRLQMLSLGTIEPNTLELLKSREHQVHNPQRRNHLLPKQNEIKPSLSPQPKSATNNRKHSQALAQSIINQ